MEYYEVEFNISTTGCSLQDARDIIAAMAGDAGFEAFEETACGTKGYVQTSMFDSNAIETLVGNFPMPGAKISYTVKEAEYKDWNEQWEKEGFEPIVIGDNCCIHDGRHLPGQDYRIMVGIDAKLAFGTGNHETTRMVVASLLESSMEGKSMLDCGCGTGILAIIALKAGATKAVGYDIDEWSVENSRHNAEENGVMDHFAVLKGDASIINELKEKFDVVTANINRNILLADLPMFCSAMNDKARLIVSGFYEEDAIVIKQHAEALGLTLANARHENGWVCLEFIASAIAG